MKEQEQFDRWMAQPLEDPELLEELNYIASQKEEIRERFSCDLTFGTAGLRGILGVGTNRMNLYTVRRATQGLCQYLLKNSTHPKAAIAYDSRKNSQRFAQETARVLAANGVKALLYKELMPTPALSYAVRQLGCDAGIVITASHNPAEYNGYKAYGADGCQMTPEVADQVLQEIESTDIFDGVKTITLEEGLRKGSIEYIGEDLIERYLQRELKEQLHPGICGQAGLKVVYTPLNGAGLRCVTEVFSRMGLKDVQIVPEQRDPDGRFPTCPYPNPEEPAALQKGLELARETGADLLIATDPDCDRVGTAVRHQGEYRQLSGNQIGVLLLDYIAKSRTSLGTLPEKPVAVKSVVTTKLADKVAEQYGVEMRTVLTGFKYIGEQIALLEEKGEENRFILGFEESYGYLSGSFVRDKDGVNASLLIAEMASFYKKEGKTLVDVLDEIQARFGLYLSRVLSFQFSGVDGMAKMDQLMEELMNEPWTRLGTLAVVEFADYKRSVRLKDGKESTITLPKSNILEAILEGGSSIIIRPSGTEPKIKVYFSLVGADETALEQQFASLREELERRMKI